MSLLILPGLVDIHTHLRVPGGEHKEDFSTGTAAALAGGITAVLAMPNTSPPLSTPDVLRKTRKVAGQAIYCDVGLFAGASPVQIADLASCASLAIGLKIYLNDTFGPLRVEELPVLMACFESWPAEKMIAMHAEGQSVAVGIGLAATYNRPLHFCHISRQDEIELIARAKSQGLPVTCEVAPHHLFLSEVDADRLGPRGDMRPRLASSKDVDALWDHIGGTIDCIATDHAPHTLEEKYSSSPPPGVAGLETSLPLMLSAVHQGRLSVERLVELMSDNPRRIFGLLQQPDTQVEVDPEIAYTVENGDLRTKCGWTPFAGMTVYGQIQRVIIRGQVAYEDGQIMAEPGSGYLLPSGGLHYKS
jgi:carbamoyl-phosphate synthase/aspartate carbamoyltransferase/dihydroorotase